LGLRADGAELFAERGWTQQC